MVLVNPALSGTAACIIYVYYTDSRRIRGVVGAGRTSDCSAATSHGISRYGNLPGEPHAGRRETASRGLIRTGSARSFDDSVVSRSVIDFPQFSPATNRETQLYFYDAAS